MPSSCLQSRPTLSTNHGVHYQWIGLSGPTPLRNTSHTWPYCRIEMNSQIIQVGFHYHRGGCEICTIPFREAPQRHEALASLRATIPLSTDHMDHTSLSMVFTNRNGRNILDSWIVTNSLWATVNGQSTNLEECLFSCCSAYVPDWITPKIRVPATRHFAQKGTSLSSPSRWPIFIARYHMASWTHLAKHLDNARIEPTGIDIYWQSVCLSNNLRLKSKTKAHSLRQRLWRVQLKHCLTVDRWWCWSIVLQTLVLRKWQNCRGGEGEG